MKWSFFLLLKIIFFYSNNFLAVIRKYEIYESNNNYPRPVLLHNNDVLGMSGYGKGYLVKFNSNAEVILKRKEMFTYDSNADIKELLGPNKGKYVIVSGENTDYKIHLFDENGIIETTETGYNTNSYKISLLPLNNGNILIGWAGNTFNSAKPIKVALFDLSTNNKFVYKKHDLWETDNKYISCVEMDSNGDIICLYVKTNCDEYYKILNSSLGYIKEFYLAHANLCGFDKIIKLGPDLMSMCYLSNNKLYCTVRSHSGSTVDTTVDTVVSDVSLMDYCTIDTKKVDVSYFSNDKFIGTCINYNTKKAQAAIATINGNSISTKVIECSGPNADYPFASKFGDNFLSVFYRSGEDNVYEIMEFPFCENFEMSLFINSKSSSFLISDHIVHGSGDNESQPLKMYFPELPQSGKVQFGNSTEIAANIAYTLEPLTYISEDQDGVFYLKFAGYNYEGKIGKWCKLTITINPCYEGCYTCTVLGTEASNECNGCKTGYYPILNKENSCANDVEYYYLNKVQSDYIWKPCYTTCKTCEKDYTTTEQNCKACKTGYYFLEGDNTGKCTDAEDGYYLDTSNPSNQILKKCYDTCGTCTSGGTADSNNCKTCAPGNYPFENIVGKCDSTDTSTSKNYYKDESDPNNIEWKLCYLSCATCDAGGDETNNNCNTCLSPYKKIYQTSQCVGQKPSDHYEDTTDPNNPVYKPCDPACSSCNGPKTATTTNCNSCSAGYIPIYTDTSNCLNSKPTGYYEYTDTSTGNKYYKECYSSCATCNQGGDVTNNNCETCKTGFYPIEGKTGSCSKDPSGYYLDNGVYKQCSEACNSCLGSPTATSTNCKEKDCANGYNAVSTDLTNCVSQRPEYYFLDENENPKIYKPCKTSCQTCNGVGTTTDAQCLSCKTNGYKIENTNNCYYTTPEGYYLDDTDPNNKVYKKCYSTCKTCSEGKDTEDNCDICKDNYYKIEQTSNCVNTPPNGYYFNTTGSNYQKCFSSCETCTQYGDNNNNNCDTCKTGFYKIEGTNNCVDTTPQYYYKDNDIYKPCDVSCETCSGGTSADCTLCRYDTNYYPKDGTTPPYECYKENIKSPGTNYYLDTTNQVFKKCYEFCATCNVGGTSKNNNCLSCITDYYPIEGITGSCVKDPPYYYKDNNVYKECYSTCEKCSQAGDDNNNNCDSCKTQMNVKTIDGTNLLNCFANCPTGQSYFEGTCQTCPEGTYVSHPYCINCKDSNKYLLEGETSCVDTVPENYYEANSNLNYYKKCDTICKTCETTMSKCLSCDTTSLNHILYDNTCITQCPQLIDGTQLYEWENTCIECPNYLFANIGNLKCENCSPGYKDINKNECLNSIPSGGHLLENTYNSFDYCYENCDECTDISTNLNDQKCTSCKPTNNNGDNLYLERSPSTNCVTSCADGLVEDSTLHKCINCKIDYSPAQYKDKNDNTQCFATKPANAYVTDTTTNTFEYCSQHCATCSGIGTSDTDQKCITCDSTTYKEYNTQNCISNCGNYYVHDDTNRLCINCQANGEYKYEDENECISTKPSNSYDIDTATGTVGKCHENCATCSGPATTDHNCITCKNGFYLQEDGKNCLSSCPLKLVQDDNKKKCINCAGIPASEGGPMYKYLDQNYCLQDKPTEAIVDISTEYNGYNILIKCYTGCSACNGAGTEEDQKCTGCTAGYYLAIDKDNCITNCGQNLVSDSSTNKCKNCAQNTGNDQFKFLVDNECVEKPPRTYVIDQQYGTIGYCYKTCKECNGEGNAQIHNCSSCLQGYYLELAPSTNCVNDCGTKLVSNAQTNKCEKCSPMQYKYPNNNNCEPTQPDATFVIDTEYNILEKCHTNCKKCSKAGTDENQNCDECIDGLYKAGPAPTNCVSTCGKLLVTDEINKQCINCKEQTNPSPQYKAENEKVCQPSLPINSYITNPEYNTFRYCDPSCKTCNNDITCITCADNYIKHPLDNTKCVNECDLSKYLWYLDHNNEYKCTNDSTCSNINEVYRGIMEPHQKQCVSNCKSVVTESYCLECMTINLYEYEGKCIETCPTGLIANNDNHKCEEDIDDGKCNEHLSNNSETNLADINSVVDSLVNSFLNSYSSNSNSHVNIIKGETYTVQIFKSDSCQYETSIYNKLSYANFSSCEQIILSKYPGLTEGDIVFAKVDINRPNEVTSQVSFKAYNKNNGEEIDLSICGTFTISYPLSNNVNLTFAEQMAEKGIDIFNPNDPFFNDFCYPYYTEDGKDVLLIDRRKDFFQNNSLCEEGCEYIQVNFKTAMVECSCNASATVIDDVNSILSNIPFNDFDKLLNFDNLVVVRCYNLVFNFVYMKRNIGSWIIVAFFLLQWPGVINFFITGLKPVYAYLNKFSSQRQLNEINSSINTSNPQKKQVPIQSSINESDTYSNEKDKDDMETPARLIQKKKIPTKLAMFDLNQKNNYIIDRKDNPPAHDIDGEINIPTKLNSNLESDNGFSHVNLKEKITEETGNNSEEKNDFEEEDLDELMYEDAIQFDNRGFCIFFWRTMKLKIIILSPFSNISLLEPFCIRLLAFFLNLSLFFVLNGILYDPEDISDRYKEEGKVGFVYLIKKEIRRCIYTSISCTIIGLLIMYLSTTKKRFLTVIEKEKDHNVFLTKIKKIVTNLKIKLTVFLIVNLILMFAFWYYVSAFCAVYQKTQMPWLESSLITFAFCIILQTLYALLITTFRYMGLRCKISCFYTVSKYML